MFIYMKSILRRELIEKRKNIKESIGDYYEMLRTSSLTSILSFVSPGSIIAGYYSINTEFDCKYILNRLYFDYGFEVCLPIVSADKVLKFKR